MASHVFFPHLPMCLGLEDARLWERRAWSKLKRRNQSEEVIIWRFATTHTQEDILWNQMLREARPERQAVAPGGHGPPGGRMRHGDGHPQEMHVACLRE